MLFFFVLWIHGMNMRHLMILLFQFLVHWTKETFFTPKNVNVFLFDSIVTLIIIFVLTRRREIFMKILFQRLSFDREPFKLKLAELSSFSFKSQSHTEKNIIISQCKCRFFRLTTNYMVWLEYNLDTMPFMLTFSL